LAAALKDTLGAVAGAAATCRYLVPPPPPPYVVFDPRWTEVILTTEGVQVLLTQAPRDDCTNGGEWYFSAFDAVTTMPTQVGLCPDACAFVAGDPSALIELAFVCMGGEV
jgi:hypothetical protein